MTKTNVYISGPLTNGDPNKIDHLKQFYEAIAQVCEEKGYNAYVPHQHTDPLTHPNVPTRDVYETDMRQVSRSDLILAYVGQASHGVGAEIERAYHEGVKVVLLYEQGARVSRLIRGCPAVIAEVQFTEQKSALEQIATCLENLPLTSKYAEGSYAYYWKNTDKHRDLAFANFSKSLQHNQRPACGGLTRRNNF